MKKESVVCRLSSVLLLSSFMILSSYVAMADGACCAVGWPEGKDPATISTRITDQFLSGRPEDYHPQGYTGTRATAGSAACSIP